MTIELVPFEKVKTVEKPWGWEKWIQPSSEVYPFVLKQLLLRGGERTSLQVHQFKSESIIILDGTGVLLTWPNFFDCEKYLNNEYTSQELDAIFNGLESITLVPNMVFHTPPGTIHRMIAHTDLLYIEASTRELDDVVRLQDDKNRQHGRINSEHK